MLRCYYGQSVNTRTVTTKRNAQVYILHRCDGRGNQACGLRRDNSSSTGLESICHEQVLVPETSLRFPKSEFKIVVAVSN